MPRAKKPKYYPPTFKIHRIRINGDDANALARHLKINDNELVNEMLDDVRKILMQHQVLVKELDESPTPGARIESLKSVQKKAAALFDEIKNLDYYTQETLYRFIPVPGCLNLTPLDPDAEYKTDLMILKKMIDRIDNAIGYLKPNAGPKRPRDKALRNTMMFLLMIFYKYNQNSKGNFRIFISDALTTAKIKHPDPSDQRTDFDKLLK